MEREVPQYNWQDITEEFKEAASHLHLGELVTEESFGLFEAMSAIEMMDPKMDAGMLCNQRERKVYNLEQSVEAGLVKIDNLTPEEIIGIMDASLATLVTWLEGHSLVQTVFTNLYLHNPYIIQDRCLKAFSIVMLKIIELIRERVNRAGCFEEEDFQPIAYGFKMASDVTERLAPGFLKDVEDDLNKRLRALKNKKGGQDDTSSESENEYQVLTALHNRVRFYKTFYAMLLSFSKDKPDLLEQAQKQITQLQELVPLMRSTVSLGTQPPNREASKNDYPTIMGFEPLINQRLLPPTFPRYALIRDRSESMDYVSSLLQRLNTITTIAGQQMSLHSTSQMSLHSTLETFMEFSKSKPCVLARSILQLVLLPPTTGSSPTTRKIFGATDFKEALKDTIKHFIAPPVLSQKCCLYNNSQCKEYVDALMSRAVRPMCSLFQITGHNRARQRDKWAHMLDDLSNLQEEADKVDAYLHSVLVKETPQRGHLACLGTWVLYHTLETMINYTLAGFELELYAPYEYHYVYWYLSELLFAWLISTLHRAETFLKESENFPDPKGRTNKKKDKNKKKRPRDLGREIALAQAKQQMFGAYYKAVVGLRLDNKLKQPTFAFDKEEVRFNHRFAPFQAVLTPPAVQYSQYMEMTDLSQYDRQPIPSDFYGSAMKGFDQAKRNFEAFGSKYTATAATADEIKLLMKIAARNSVLMMVLKSGHTKDSTDPPKFDFTEHSVYPNIKLP